MKCIIVDDESLARQRLVRLLKELEFIEICGEASNGMEALKLADEMAVETVLLDIRMPGMDGLEVAHHLSNLDPAPAVIFTTAYGDHALEAFEANAIDYLLKPIDRTRLSLALEKAQRLTTVQLKELAAVTPESSTRTHLCANVRGDLKLIPIEDVLYLQADQKYVTVRTRDTQVLIEESLKALEEEFPDNFIRIHRNALVANTVLRGLEKDVKGHAFVVIEGIDDRLEVSRRLLPEIRRLIKSGQSKETRKSQSASELA
jgi:two-component system response regulator AlgR